MTFLRRDGHSTTDSLYKIANEESFYNRKDYSSYLYFMIAHFLFPALLLGIYKAVNTEWLFNLIGLFFVISWSVLLYKSIRYKELKRTLLHAVLEKRLIGNFDEKS